MAETLDQFYNDNAKTAALKQRTDLLAAWKKCVSEASQLGIDPWDATCNVPTLPTRRDLDLLSTPTHHVIAQTSPGGHIGSDSWNEVHYLRLSRGWFDSWRDESQ